MQHAAGAAVLAQIVDAFFERMRGIGAARIEGMQNRGGGVPIRAHPYNAVPESIYGHGSRFYAKPAHLSANIGQRSRGDSRQLFGIDFPAAVLSSVRPVFHLRAEALDLFSVE